LVEDLREMRVQVQKFSEQNLASNRLRANPHYDSGRTDLSPHKNTPAYFSHQRKRLRATRSINLDAGIMNRTLDNVLDVGNRG
jgi:hypothetical protein